MEPCIVIIQTSREVCQTIVQTCHADITMWVFCTEELLFDPTSNPMVPPHRLATEEEVRGIDPNTLPTAFHYDIVVRWMGFRRGDVIAIDRPYGTYLRMVQ